MEHEYSIFLGKCYCAECLGAKKEPLLRAWRKFSVPKQTVPLTQRRLQNFCNLDKKPTPSSDESSDVVIISKTQKDDLPKPDKTKKEIEKHKEKKKSKDSDSDHKHKHKHHHHHKHDSKHGQKVLFPNICNSKY